MTHTVWNARAMALSFALVFWGCTDKIVYKDLPDFVTPPEGAAGFLGFSDVDTKRTTCGNCHSGKQAVWQNTAHSNAWGDLVQSGARAKECEACHSVSHKGNSSADSTAGYVGTQNARYENVQCESCHGPGLQHVTNPDIQANKPLASLAVGAALKNGCGECHSGSHQPFVEQWEASRHGKAVGSRNQSSCWSCHEAKHALAAWGVNSNYVEVGDTARATALPVVCTVCHDPHNAKNPNQLRFPVDVADVETNLCMKCHHRRAEPEVTSSSGPHSPQGPVLLGEAGWTPPGFQYPPGSLVGTHGSDRNPRLCATCHVNSYTVNDALTGKFSFKATGHSFQPIPCVDGSGIPTGVADCDDAQRSFKACVSCHGTENAARTARAVAKLRLTTLAAEMDALVARIPANQFSTTDNRITTGEGCKFNSGLAKERGSPIHNPFLIEALLLACKKQIGIDYGLTAISSLSLRPQLQPPPNVKVK
ncbi:MAG TPA: cytochrome c3 family protein [Gemmatimonadaceae bacterium]